MVYGIRTTYGKKIEGIYFMQNQDMGNSFYAHFEENKTLEVSLAEILLLFDLGEGRRSSSIYIRVQLRKLQCLTLHSIKSLLLSLGFLFSANFRVCLRVFIVGITLSNINLE